MAAPSALQHYRSPRNVFLIATAGFAVLVMATIASIVSGYMELTLINEAQAGARITSEEANANDRRQMLVAYMFLGISVLATVAFLFWIYRISDNADILKQPTEQVKRFSPWGAVGWWFCPILNLFRPYQVVKELWLRNEASGPRAVLMPVWWFLWIVNGIIGQFFLRQAFSGNQPATIDELKGQNQLGLFSDGLTIVAIALVVIVIWLITKGQERKHRRLSDAARATAE